MIKDILTKLREEKDLEKRFFKYATFYTSIIAILSLLINVFSNLDPFLYILSILFFVLSTSAFYLSQIDSKYNTARNGFFIFLMLLLDISYFFNAGIDSSIPYVLITIFLIINLVIKRRKIEQISILIAFILNILFLFYLEKTYPHLITPYPSLEAKEFDLIGGFVAVSFLVFIVINFFKSTYEKLLNDIDIKNKELILSEKEAKEERDKAEKANNAKRDFLSVMSHEIRTPLNAIISIIHLLETNENNKDITNEEGFIKTLKYSSDNLLALVSNILDFTKIDSGEVKLEEANFNLQEVLQSLLIVYKPQAKERNNRLNLNFEGFNNYNFHGDSLRLTQILINLLSNAIKFTENGSIDINIKILEEDKVNNTARVYFEVKDTGIGVSEEKREDIFEKFTQENLSITRKYGGSGLGLSITKKLVELMNSKVYLESEVGKGSKFFFEVDLKLSEQPNITEIKPEKENLSDIKILLVEDNKINIAVTTKFFDRWKINYEVAENGLIALDKFEKNNYNLILMDLQMPEMDGFTATQKIREMDKSIPIIALTANSMAEEKERCLNSGFNEYLTKPFKPDALKDSIVHFYNKSVKNIGTNQ